MNIGENVRRIREAIDAAALRAGAKGGIRLVAATKTHPPEIIQEAIRAGIRDCGENRVQEMLRKIPLGAYEGARLHFIGHLQSNKVKYVVGAVSLIQSVDSKSLYRSSEQGEEARHCSGHSYRSQHRGETSRAGSVPTRLRTSRHLRRGERCFCKKVL